MDERDVSGPSKMAHISGRSDALSQNKRRRLAKMRSALVPQCQCVSECETYFLFWGDGANPRRKPSYLLLRGLAPPGSAPVASPALQPRRRALPPAPPNGRMYQRGRLWGAGRG